MVNKVILVGNLGRDPEMRYTQSGTAVCNFTLATSETYKNEKKTEWHKVVCFGKLAEVCGQYLQKGKLIYCDGKIQTRAWDDKDGNKRYTTEVLMGNMQMLGGKRFDSTGDSDADVMPVDEDVPF